MSQTIKLQSVLLGGHVHTTVHVGPTNGTLAGIGELVNDVDGYRFFRDVVERGVHDGDVAWIQEGDSLMTHLERLVEQVTS